jgi:hypothetical protein
MSTLKVLIGFSKIADDELDTKAAKIILDMTGNTNYPTPVPDLPTVQAALNVYEDSLVSAKNGGPEKTAIKDKKRLELELLLKQLGTYVQLNCKNDLSILLSSGFDANKPNTPIGMLAKPENVKVENGPNQGTMKVSTDKINGAQSYRFEYALTPLSPTVGWVVNVGTARTFLMEGMASGKEYAFRVAGVGADPTIVYSDVVMKFAQ